MPDSRALRRRPGNLTLEFRPDRRLPVVPGNQLAFGPQIRDFTVIHLKTAVGGHVPLHAVREGRHHHQSLGGFGTPHSDLVRHQAQRKNLGLVGGYGSRRSRKQQRGAQSQDGYPWYSERSADPDCPFLRRLHCSYSFLPPEAAAPWPVASTMMGTRPSGSGVPVCSPAMGWAQRRTS